MDDMDKTKEQLLQELSGLRIRLKDANESQAYQAAREAEEALQRSEEKFRSIFENATEGIFQSTPEGRFINVNPAFAKMCGFTSPDEMLATISNISDQHYANPDERKTFVQLIRKNGKIENFVHQVLRKDGERIWVSTNARAIKDKNGRIIRYEGTHENITKRKLAEEELRKNEEMLKSIFRAAPIGIGIVHDRILGWTNEYLSSITGYSQNELIGQSARILYPDDEEFKWVGDTKYRQIRSQGIGSVETHWLKKNGSAIDIFLSSSYVNPSDPSVGLVFTALDITKRKATENKLRYYTELLHLVLDVSTSFINLSPRDINTGINNALKMIGEFVRVDRSYLFQFREGGLTMDNTHEWCTQSTSPQIQRLQGITADDMPWFFNQIQKLDFVHIPEVNKLPQEAYAEKEEFRTEDIKSLITVPIMHGGSLLGFLGLDSVQEQKVWSMDEISLLKVIGEIFANVLVHRRSEEARNALLAAIPDIMFRLDAAGTFLDFNSPDSNDLLLPPEQFLGKKASDVLSLDLARLMEEKINETLTTGKLVNYEYETVIGDQQKYWEARMAVCGKDQVMTIIRDITERKLFEERLIESEERYRTSIENSNDGVAIVKGDKHLYVNRKFVEIFGYDSAGEIIGQPVVITVHPDDREKVAQINRKRQQDGGAPSRYEFKGLKKNGDVVTVEVSATKTTYSGESMSLVYLRDVTERRSLEAQLLHAQKMEAVGQLAGGVAHDFNNILTAIIGYGSLLHMKMLEDEPLRVYAEHILASAQKATHLTQSLLAFSRKQILNPEPANVNEILLNVRRLLSRTIGEDIELMISVGEDELTIVADVVQIEQVLMNLAINARDAMPDGGTMTIGIEPVYMDSAYVQRNNFGRPGHFVRISVTDTGIGMDEATKERIFEPFFTTKEVGKGTGLGLSMVYGIVNQHNGFLRVFSELLKGTTFEMYLPLIRTQATVARKKEDIPFLPGTGVILMAEDDTTVRQLAKQFLEDAGYTVIEAFDGEDVIAKFNDNKERVDLLLLDTVMPKKDGKEAYETISHICPGVKALFMSGYSEDIIHKRGILQDGLNFIAKPVAPNALLKKIREVLEQAPEKSDSTS
jgi:PAS domain S-box-containing protein